MSDQRAISSADLIEGIIQGKVPRHVRLFAAQGLLPVSREDLLSLFFLRRVHEPLGERSLVATAQQQNDKHDRRADQKPDQGEDHFVQVKTVYKCSR